MTASPETWQAIRLAYFRARRRPPLSALAKTYGVPYLDVLDLAKRERWRWERLSIECRRRAGKPARWPACLGPPPAPAPAPPLPSNVIRLSTWRGRRGGGTPSGSAA